MSTAVRVTLKRLFLFLLLVSTIDGLAPNFDTFCQNAVGHWASAGSSSSSATVSEVMRSCGGAVQGVRETGGGAGVYLNRADDNFAYFDDGSFTTTSDDGSITVCLAHSRDWRRRLDFKVGPDFTLAGAPTIALQRRVPTDSPAPTVDEMDEVEVEVAERGGCFDGDVEVLEQISGKGARPWVFMRVKWTTQLSDPIAIRGEQVHGGCYVGLGDGGRVDVTSIIKLSDEANGLHGGGGAGGGGEVFEARVLRREVHAADASLAGLCLQRQVIRR
mmetsp:Transcript_16690/g.43663  ORF Transcript_16690/g.43663 Transcript_16690/m.43663 type:complete len:274 (-) Transcript_16690:301-1122(-)